MARAIVTCAGETINMGNKVRTKHGNVIKVTGGMVIQGGYYNAEECKLVPKETKTTAEENAAKLTEANTEAKNAGEEPIKPVGGAQSDGDCIVWGG